VRPDHLFLGTNADNMADMAEKKRGKSGDNRGERSGNARLTEAQVRIIRSTEMQNTHVDLLAARFGVSRQAIYDVRWRRTWDHLD